MALKVSPVTKYTMEAPRIMTLAPLGAIIIYGMLLLAFHVHADGNESWVGSSRTHDFANNDAAPDSFVEDVFSLWLDRVLIGPHAWNGPDKILFWAFIMFGVEALDLISKNLGIWTSRSTIPVRGKHLDELSPKDNLFIGLNKAATPPLVYFILRYSFFAENVIWDMSQISLINLVLPLPVLFLVFDFFYTIIHWALHIKAIYGYIHKHHHHQKAPSRATVDAVNVHPIEYFLGEYDHLLSLVLVSQVMQIHIITVLLLMSVGGILAGLNHTRFDFCWEILGVKIYDSKAHDVHHRIPQSNYGQYTMFWDSLFGTFRPYNSEDRVNPKAQLDPVSGKSYEYMENKRLVSKLDG